MRPTSSFPGRDWWLLLRLLVGSVGVLVGPGAVVVRFSRVLLCLIVPAVPVMVRCLPMVMCRSFMVARRGMVMFGGGMSSGCGHELPPVEWGRACSRRDGDTSTFDRSLGQPVPLTYHKYATPRSHDSVCATQFTSSSYPVLGY